MNTFLKKTKYYNLLFIIILLLLSGCSSTDNKQIKKYQIKIEDIKIKCI